MGANGGGYTILCTNKDVISLSTNGRMVPSSERGTPQGKTSSQSVAWRQDHEVMPIGSQREGSGIKDPIGRRSKKEEAMYKGVRRPGVHEFHGQAQFISRELPFHDLMHGSRDKFSDDPVKISAPKLRD